MMLLDISKPTMELVDCTTARSRSSMIGVTFRDAAPVRKTAPLAFPLPQVDSSKTRARTPGNSGCLPAVRGTSTSYGGQVPHRMAARCPALVTVRSSPFGNHACPHCLETVHVSGTTFNMSVR